MKQTEILYFDVDGTLLDNATHSISNSTIEALQTLKNNGYKLAVCTGRTVGTIKNTKIRNLVNWDGYVLTNGSTVLNSDFELVDNNLFKKEFIEELLEIYPSSILLESDEIYLLNDLSENMKDFLIAHNIDIPAQTEYNGLEVPKVTIDDVNLIEGGLDHPIFKDTDYERNSYGMYEFTCKNGGKHNGIKKLNKYLNVSESIFFGDGINDVDALKYASLGIAMGNAVTEAKDASDYVTSSVSEDGIYNALKHFKII